MNDATPAAGLSRARGATSHRLASGGLIDRAQRLAFTFDGQTFAGHPGDTLASALVANGVRLVGRSFKYHRPRGILSAGPEEPNALVELRSGSRREPNTRATTAELYQGLDATSQNRWPSLRFDLMALNGLLGPVVSAGFYYKTFMWPSAFWEKVYEPLIRRAAGLGRASGEPDPDTYEKADLHCDVLVVGAGPAGLMAALAAGRTGARVVIADDDFRLGGRLIADRRSIDGRPGHAWVEAIEAELASLREVRILRRTSIAGVYDHGRYAAVERVSDHLAVPPPFTPRQRLWRIHAKRSVLAAGAIERPLVFAGNDRPGIMLAGAVRAYVNRFAALAGRRAVVFTTNDDAARTVDDLARAGADVLAVVDTREAPGTAVTNAVRAAGAEFFPGSTVEETYGHLGLEGVHIRTARNNIVQLSCDLLAVSGGWTPSVHLASHLGGRPQWREAIGAFVPGTLPPGMSVAGAAGGDFSLADALSKGATAGLGAAVDAGFSGCMPDLPSVDPDSAAGSAPAPMPSTRGKAFVDFQNDVTASDIALGHREGYRSVEHLKRYTTLGMATDQGKTSNVNGLVLLAELSRSPIAAAGTTTFRPPFTPVAIGTLAGHHRGADFRPTRLPPSHAWEREQGGDFIESGPWLRAQWYPRDGETDWLVSVSREVRTVRTAVGVCDVSTLGKIDVQGPDAATFLDRVYANTISTLGVGRVRYGLMLREDGHVFDDGTVTRLEPERFLVTTTTANAAKALQHMELVHQWLSPELDVAITSVSEQWAQFSLAGPNARDVLAKIVDDGQVLSNAALPHMAARAVTVLGGLSARLFRISYSGELAYELAVPAGYGDALVRAIMTAGRAHAIAPYGIEALGVLRIEKGHVAGNEMNGQTTARDLGLGRLVSSKKDFIGRAMAMRPGLVDPARPALVGLKPIDRTRRLRAGAHLVAADAVPSPQSDEGYVTSVAYSPTLGHWIALALLANGPARHGQRIRVWDPVRAGDVMAEVVSPVFYDPTGSRQHG
jgi:methylglutamate dehydrogenase subunit C